MNWPATIANSLWLAAGLPAAASFRRALNYPAEVQERLLLDQIARHEDTAFGRKYGFKQIKSYEDFSGRLPIVTYEEIEPWIQRIKNGEVRVLTSDPVTHLVPTSGSSGARKLIPFTKALQRQFDNAIAPWMADLARQNPGIVAGPAYWSISPPITNDFPEPSPVPIGFSDDAEYLGGLKGRLVRAALVAPQDLPAGCGGDAFRYETLKCLLLARDLRLVSVWHPSFLTLLLDALPAKWDRLLSDIGAFDYRRSAELRRCHPADVKSIWPNLAVISCWGDGMAELPLKELGQRMPNVMIQPKGLLATEACVTIPIGNQHPLAICSHFFEFIDGQGKVRRCHELMTNETYEVVVTTTGGLWRYRLGDCVQVTGFIGRTPSLRFLGRAGNVSDRFGEKLSESFVADTIQELVGLNANLNGFALMAPSQILNGWCYTLYVGGHLSSDAVEKLEVMLCRNPHYKVCRQLGQLQPAQVRMVGAGAYERYVAHLTSQGMKLGDIKPASLSTLETWNSVFID
jgi:hypothetical protein